jgi:ABC-type transport system substrate-binding protein
VGTLTIAMHFRPVTRWLDPADGESTITPFLLLYALHDGLLKPMPGVGSGPSLAESWSMSKDMLVADFTLRANAKFHTRLESFVTRNGAFAYGALPEVDDLFRRQACELDRKKREALLHQIQNILHEQVVQAPVYHLASPSVSGRGWRTSWRPPSPASTCRRTRT